MVDLKTSAYGRRVLEQSPLFAQMDENSRRDLIGQAMPRSFGVGETVCRIGDPGGSMMAVLTGTVRISMPTVKGKEVILGDLHPGDLFGEIADAGREAALRQRYSANEMRAVGAGAAERHPLPRKTPRGLPSAYGTALRPNSPLR